MTINERVQQYASSYSGILPDEVIESSKEWWRKELEEVRAETLKEAVRAIEGLKKKEIFRDDHPSNTRQYGEVISSDCEWNDALSTAITAVEGIQNNN